MITTCATYIGNLIYTCPLDFVVSRSGISITIGMSGAPLAMLLCALMGIAQQLSIGQCLVNVCD